MRIDPDDATDVPDGPWEVLQPLRPERPWRPGGPGRPPCDVRRVLPGLLSLHQTGCPWRLVPKAFGHWSPSSGDFQRWRRDGGWARVRETRRPWERRDLGRQPAPAAGRIESQRIQTATHREAIGVAGHQTIQGRKQHLLVNPLGLIRAVVVRPADTDDRLGVVEWLRQYVAAGVKRLRTIWGAGAYPAEWLEAGVRGGKPTQKIDLEATTNTEGTGFPVIPWRWAVERTFAWLRNDRRQSRDDERLTANSAAMIQMSMIRLLLNRWA